MEKRKVVILRCGESSTLWGETPQEILSTIFWMYGLKRRDAFATNYELVEWLDRNIFNGKFEPSKQKAERMLDDPTMQFLKKTKLGVTARQLLYWYARWGKEEKIVERTLFDYEERI